MDKIEIRKAVTLDDLHRVYRLTHDSFVAAGLCKKQSHQMVIHHPDQDVIPETIIFLVEIKGELVGTVSFTIDSEFGLMVDSGFKQQIDKYRKFYGKVANFWRLAIAPAYRNDTRILRHLLGIIASCLLKNQIPVCFFTFSPEHARIYEKLVNTEEVCRGVDSNELIDPKHAEVVLMKLYPDKVPDKWFSIIGEEALV
jgi:hypothetical protein